MWDWETTKVYLIGLGIVFAGLIIMAITGLGQ